jgi:hypothetical protein
MAPQRPQLNPDESAALTRLVLSYCLGRGSICLCSRTYSLQLHQPRKHHDYTLYQWRRLRQYLPDIKEPRYYPTANSGGEAGQWRVRVSSKSFETAFNLLYPDGFHLSSAVLELLGAEAIGSLWADRGRVLMTRKGNYCNGRLNLSRYSFAEAELLHEWIHRLTGAEGRVHHSARSVDAPMLYYDSLATELLVAALRSTWMAQAPCLARKFRVPERQPTQILSADSRERLQAEMMMPQVYTRRTPGPLLQPRGNRRVPGLQERPRPEQPPLLNREAG